MQSQSGIRLTLSRYLTLIYSITLGLALLLAFLAISWRGNIYPYTSTPAQVVLSSTSSPTLESTSSQTLSTPTPLPALPPTPNEKTPSALGVTSEELDGVKVSLWHPWTGETGIALQEILDEFNHTNRWGITVQTSNYDGFGRLDEAVETAMISDALPDVLVDYGYQARHWYNYNALLDLTPYIDDPVWGLTSEEQADFYPEFWAEDIVKEGNLGQTRRLAIPYYRSAYALFYNQSWAHELGFLHSPTTPEDFRGQACAAAEFIARGADKSILGRGGWLITPQPGALIGWIYAFGGEIINPETQDYNFDTAETRQAFEYLKSLQESGCAWSENEAEPAIEFASRHALFVVGSLYDIQVQQNGFDQAGSTDKWIIIPFPGKGQPVVDAYGPSIMITRSTPEKQLAAWLVTEWLVYPPNQAAWVEVLGAYPTRLSTLNHIDKAASANSQWGPSLEFLPGARPEPSLASWSVMRWALQDGMAQLFNQEFKADQIPSLLENLDRIASEIVTQVR